ncbi:unnamed protein product [Cuscuta campestris]|uniref:Uncharacterized protein n=1 Tax=Cuscuta campestris TaxID=132261 RepID=A0A484N5U6_9ASTE|nr:unnamed protein product [Cuscuta campestris]
MADLKFSDSAFLLLFISFSIVLTSVVSGKSGAAAVLLLACGAAVLLVLVLRTTVVAWITVIVMLAFVGKRRRVLAEDGARITSDVALYLAKVAFRERGGGALAFICATTAAAALGLTASVWNGKSYY